MLQAPPSDDEIAKLRPGQKLIGFLAPQRRQQDRRAQGPPASRRTRWAIPRISRAQVMDALSSRGNVSGYKSVILAAEESTRFFPMLTTAAGTVKPATVLVLGVGVAGLQAWPPPNASAPAPPATTCGPGGRAGPVRGCPSGSTSVSGPPARQLRP